MDALFRTLARLFGQVVEDAVRGELTDRGEGEFRFKPEEATFIGENLRVSIESLSPEERAEFLAIHRDVAAAVVAKKERCDTEIAFELRAECDRFVAIEL